MGAAVMHESEEESTAALAQQQTMREWERERGRQQIKIK